MHRIVLFGLDGTYATVVLHALAAGGLRPSLIVVGRERPPGTLRGAHTIHRAQPGVWARLQAKLRTSEDDDPADGNLIAAAHRHGIDVLETDAANEHRARAVVEAAAPDAIVVAGFPHLFSRAVLAIPKRGGLNIHPGRLPAERGPAPLFWALRDGQTTITITIHMLDEGEDTGDIVSTVNVPFEPGTTGTEILALCGQAAAPLVVRAMRSLLAGDLVRQPQPTPTNTRHPRPRFRDGRLDPHRSAQEVFTFAAACADRYSLFAECGGDRFFIRRAVSYQLHQNLDFEFVLTGDRLILRCTPGVVELELKEDGALFTAEYADDDHVVI